MLGSYEECIKNCYDPRECLNCLEFQLWQKEWKRGSFAVMRDICDEVIAGKITKEAPAEGKPVHKLSGVSLEPEVVEMRGKWKDISAALKSGSIG